MIKEKKNIALFPLGFLDYDVYKRCAITITAGYEILTTQWSKFWIRGSTVRYHKLTLTTPEGGDQHLISNGRNSVPISDRWKHLKHLQLFFTLVSLCLLFLQSG